MLLDAHLLTLRVGSRGGQDAVAAAAGDGEHPADSDQG